MDIITPFFERLRGFPEFIRSSMFCSAFFQISAAFPFDHDLLSVRIPSPPCPIIRTSTLTAYDLSRQIVLPCAAPFPVAPIPGKTLCPFCHRRICSFPQFSTDDRRDHTLFADPLIFRVLDRLLCLKIEMETVHHHRSLIKRIADHPYDKTAAQGISCPLPTTLAQQDVRDRAPAIPSRTIAIDLFYDLGFFFYHHDRAIRTFLETKYPGSQHGTFTILLPVAVGIIDLLAQLTAVLFCQYGLDPCDQRIVRRIKFALYIHEQTFTMGQHPVQE